MKRSTISATDLTTILKTLQSSLGPKTPEECVSDTLIQTATPAMRRGTPLSLSDVDDLWYREMIDRPVFIQELIRLAFGSKGREEIWPMKDRPPGDLCQRCGHPRSFHMPPLCARVDRSMKIHKDKVEWSRYKLIEVPILHRSCCWSRPGCPCLQFINERNREQ